MINKKLFLILVCTFFSCTPLPFDMYELQMRSSAPMRSLMQIMISAVVHRFNGFQGVRRVPLKKKAIALTFDDGPHSAWTPALLDILKDRQIPATFFVTGSCVVRSPAIVKRALQEGHEIGNHSWDHPQLPKIDSTNLHHQLADTNDAIQKISGKRVTLMRMPYGITNSLISWLVQHNYGMKIINWSVDPMDWKKPGPFVLLHRIMKTVRPGSILLFHDIHKETIQVMPAILDALSAEGYEFVTVSKLLSMGKKRNKRR